jgi:hypothetical protein
VEPVDLIETYGSAERPQASKTGLRRNILSIFNEWHKEPLTAERIKELLEENGSTIELNTLYVNLKTLTKMNVLEKMQLPSKGERGRPSYGYRLRAKAIYDLFKLTEDLVDAMDFAQIEGEPGKAYVAKLVIKCGDDCRSIRSPPQAGKLAQVMKRAEDEDFEKSWRLAQHITELQNHCSTDSPAYQEYELKKCWEFSRNTKGLDGMSFPGDELSWEEFRDGFRAAEKSENGVAKDCGRDIRV